MRRKNSVLKDPAVKSVQRQFKIWREKRKGREAIPERLWRAAIRLTEDYSVNQVSQSLSLNHTELSTRVSRHGRRKKSTKVNHFVELDCSRPFPLAAGSRCELELENSDGRKLRLRGDHPGELVESIRSLWKPFQ